jgi:hypothetical protein
MSGNAFADTIPFDHKKIPAIVKKINKVLTKAKVKSHPVGSGANPTPGKESGDLDIIVDADQLANHFQDTDIKSVRKKLRAMFDAAGFQTSQSGVSVHVRVEIKNEPHQVDIMIVKDAAHAAGFHTHDIPENSPYKGSHKHMIIADLAREQNLLWSPYEGLFTRNSQGKKNKLLTNDLEDIAKTLLGDDAKSSDLGSVEAILAKLPKNRIDSVMKSLNQNSVWVKSLKTESLAVRKLKQINGTT